MKLNLLILVLFFLLACQEDKNTSGAKEFQRLTGPVFGTSFSIIYDLDRGYQKEIDSLYYVLNTSLSTYQINSDISKVNRNELTEVDAHFKAVFEMSQNIYSKTEGAFDPTIGAVVNAWDFGPEGDIVDLDSLRIDSLMSDVGLDRIRLENNKIYKPQNTFIDFNAIAKGYAVDVVAEFLEQEGSENYLVEIGGEIRVKGINIESGETWRVGIEEPRFDGEQSIMKTLALRNESMATSGVYRKFKIDENGNRYSHIIDTNTGYPSKTNILSVSVIARSCIVADAYATAFKSMGIDRIKSFLESNNDLKVYIIFENEQGDFETLSLNGFPD